MRVSAFVVATAQTLARKNPSIAGTDGLERLLEEAIAALPPGKLRTAVESDLSRFAALFTRTVKEFVQSHQCDNERNLLEVSQGAVITSSDLRKSLEAVIQGTENSIASGEQLKEWANSCRRLLVSCPDAPLALWWAYAAVELYSLQDQSQEKKGTKLALHVVSSAKALMHHLKGLTDNPLAAVTSLAPVVAALYDAGFILAAADSCTSKSWRKAVSGLKSVCQQVLGSTALYTSREEVIPSRSFGNEDSSLDKRALVLVAKALTKLAGNDSTDSNGIAKLFPLSSRAVRNSLVLEKACMENFASVVIAEAVLMLLMVSILERRGECEGKIDKENPKFADYLRLLVMPKADVLVDVLFDPILPVDDVLNTEEELFLRGILYDVVLVTSPELISEHIQDGESKATFPIFLKKLELSRRAIEFYRSQGAGTKAIALSSCVTTWSIPTGFSQWLQSLKVKEKPPRHILQDSRALIGWLAKANDGVIANILAKCGTQRGQKNQKPTKLEITRSEISGTGEMSDSFFVDTKGDPNTKLEDDFKAANKAFTTAAETMKEKERGNSEELEEGNEQDGVHEEPMTDGSDDEEEGRENDEDDKKRSIGEVAEQVLKEAKDGEAMVDRLTHELVVGEAADAALNKPKPRAEVTVAEIPSAQSMQPASPVETAAKDCPGDKPGETLEPMETDNQAGNGSLQEERSPRKDETKKPKATRALKTPATITPQTIPSVRCTRSGRKYGDFAQQSDSALTTKRRRVTKAATASTAADSPAPE